MKAFDRWMVRVVNRRWKVSRLAGTGAGLFLGVFLMTLLSQIAVGTWGLSQGNSQSSYLVVSYQREVTADKLDELKAQPFVLRAAPLRSATFHIFASVGFGGGGYGSEIFMESLPPSFLDVQPPRWGWTPQDPEVPIIITREFLALYNHGFAPTRGLPKVNEAQVSMVPLELRISGKGRTLVLKAKIVGFTDRVSSILVPEEFLLWGQKNLGERPEKVGRVLMEVRDPGDPSIANFAQNSGWSVNQERLIPSQWAAAAQLVIFLVWLLAVLALLGGFFLAQWSLSLTLLESKRERDLLFVMGFDPKKIWYYFIRLPLRIGFITSFLGLTGALVAHGMIAGAFHGLGLPYTESPWVVPLIGLFLLAMGLVLYRPKNSHLSM